MIIITKRKLEEIKKEYMEWCKFEIRRAGIEAKARAEMEALTVGNKLKAETLAKEDQLLERIRKANKDILTLAEILKKHREDIDRIEEVGGEGEMFVEELRLKVEQLEEVIKNDRKTD